MIALSEYELGNFTRKVVPGYPTRIHTSPHVRRQTFQVTDISIVMAQDPTTYLAAALLNEGSVVSSH